MNRLGFLSHELCIHLSFSFSVSPPLTSSLNIPRFGPLDQAGLRETDLLRKWGNQKKWEGAGGSEEWKEIIR